MNAYWMLAGPTAVGKSEFAIALAEKIGGEVVSADSRQIYKDLNIGTAKPTPEERARVRHHFIDELSLDTRYSAGRFQVDANRRIGEIIARDRLPIVVGGSTLYLHALKHGLAEIPTVSDEVLIDVQMEFNRGGSGALFSELERVDPRSAAQLDPTKTQRLIRSVAVHRETGRPLSAFHEIQEPPPYTFQMIVLYRERTELYRRINQRVDDMIAQGLLDEVRTILARGYDPAINPLRTIGYQEPIRYLRGEIAEHEMVRLIKRNSRRYAKRQLTWFRRDGSNMWIDASQRVEELMSAIHRATGNAE